MDIDDDNSSSAGTLITEGQAAAANSTTSTEHTAAFTVSPLTAEEPARTAPEEDPVLYDSTRPDEESSPEHLALSYSPLGLASTAWTVTGHTALPTTVHSLLPDAQGICHYHRPGFDGMRVLPRSLISRGLELRSRQSAMARTFELAHRESMVRLEASQRALEQVVRRLASTRRCMIPDPGPATATEAEHPDGWVSEEEEPLTRQAYDLMLRMQVRSSTRRANGVSKHVGSRGIRGRCSEVLGAAYTRQLLDDQRTRDQVTAMGQADADEITAMLRRGVSVNLTDSNGRSPLHVACSCGNLDAVRLLLQRGADVNAVDGIGNTPLTIAATGARSNVILLLLEAGADPRIGQGLVSAMAMVRSRLRLLRRQIQHARSVELAASMSFTDVVPRIRERRKQSVLVAKECVEIIHLLRDYTRRHQMADDRAPAESEPALGDVAELDSLAEQLVSMEIGAGKGKMPELLSMADDDTQGSEPPDEDGQIDELLAKFSLLLGDKNDNEKE
ncbi:hypothetical protein IWW39_001247 [Coemansia spiralis]|uniref:Uncharacterized protein n=1 Tax=Coemansia spiralis TaxID=417178 RepID=A0A9W8L6E8_9FUNG|nr:hypothetical protein IWW39_001247 [Coemansia spiralis]